MSTESDVEICRQSIRKMRNPEPVKIDTFFWGFVSGVFFCLLLALSGCTTASITTAEGVQITYRSFAPFGNATQAHAEWVGVGSLSVSRDSAGAAETIGAVGAILP